MSRRERACLELKPATAKKTQPAKIYRCPYTRKKAGGQKGLLAKKERDTKGFGGNQRTTVALPLYCCGALELAVGTGEYCRYMCSMGLL